jgi:dTDP-4-dehydrorhamnose reductase
VRRVAVTGAGGLLGSTLVERWRLAGAEVVAWRRRDFDVADSDAALAAIGAARPEVVVHAAGYTAVDRAEAESREAMRVNRDGARSVSRACARLGVRVAYLSTDYLFGDGHGAPIAPEAPPAPLNAYGRSKAAGEAEVRDSGARWLVLRTAWLYGPGGSNFVDAMREAALQGREVKVVDDQRGAPTASALVSDVLWELLDGGADGVWHAAASGEATWFAVAREVFEAAGASAARVRPCSSAEAGRAARRPAYSVLDCRATASRLGVSLPDWREQVRAYVQRGALPGLGKESRA